MKNNTQPSQLSEVFKIATNDKQNKVSDRHFCTYDYTINSSNQFIQLIHSSTSIYLYICYIQGKNVSQAWWHIYLTPALRKQEANLVYTANFRPTGATERRLKKMKNNSNIITYILYIFLYPQELIIHSPCWYQA